ncbi:MAG TPA: acyl-CoA dehydrogenase family protein [Acidimicrobiia bacterium]|nr:acyl-CoA dehydrogenase family protein [Acidimicrobiia bacterium]
MDLRYTPAEQQFRAELRAWLDDVLPSLPSKPDPDDWPARREYDTAWQRMLFDAGYAGINWPTEYGGRGASPSEHLIFLEETERLNAPYVGVNFVGLLHAGPTLIAEASDEQRGAHLPAILRGDEVWCQGFSEPGAGSDLASLRTRAVLDGDHYVVSGQKIWTSHAEVADYCELLVRTDPDAPKHRGITWLIMPMDLPGIEVRPLRTIHGSTEFAELFLDEVRIPAENRVGAQNDGWRVAMVTFSFERGTAFVSEMLQSMELVRSLATLARELGREDLTVRRELGHLAAELDALWALTKRNVSQAARTGVPGVGGSVFKLHYSEVRQRLGELSMHVLDRAGLSIADIDGIPNGQHVYGQIHALSLTIAAGTSQIQRNIVGERVLGLPKER